MRKIFHVLLAVFVLTLAGCSDSAAPQTEETPQVPDESPSVTKEIPYNGGFTKEMRVADAQTIIGLFERNYAPRDWKQESLGVSFEEMSKAFLEAAAKDMEDEAFYGLIAQYLSAFDDSHIGYYFPSTALAYLSISTDYIDGKVIITHVDADASDRVAVGNEIIEVDGVSIKEVLKNNLKYIGEGNPATALRFAASRISFKPQSQFPILPDDAGTAIVVKSLITDETNEIVLEWTREGNEFAEFNDPGIDLTSKTKSQSLIGKQDPTFDRDIRMFSRADAYGHVSLGDVEPFFPMGDNFILRKAEPYYVGIFLVEDKRIGYIRIHDFHGGTYSFKDAIAQLEEDIPYLEETTDALILDETGNPGGSWHYAATIGSFFFDKPFQDLNDSWKANRATLAWAEGAVEYFKENPKDDEYLEWFELLAEEVRNAMKRGDLLTKPFPIVNVSGKLEPYTTEEGVQISYTKPMLLLMNELSVSCGDLFPALMKDNDRVTLFGARTMGGGGAVNWTSQIGYSETAIGHTISLVVRNESTEFNGKETTYIENVGVKPDIEYQITLDDFMTDYELYREYAIEAVLSLIDNKVQDEIPIDEEIKEEDK